MMTRRKAKFEILSSFLSWINESKDLVQMLNMRVSEEKRSKEDKYHYGFTYHISPTTMFTPFEGGEGRI